MRCWRTGGGTLIRRLLRLGRGLGSRRLFRFFFSFGGERGEAAFIDLDFRLM